MYSVFAVLFGILVFIYGGIDDSPGAQLLGFIAAIIGIWGIMKSRKM